MSRKNQPSKLLAAGKHSYNEFVDILLSTCQKNKHDVHSVGTVGNDSEYHIYRVLVNPGCQKHLLITAGIHGDEVAGPYGLLDFMDGFSQDGFGDLGLTIFPLLNPSGYERGTRRNFERKDINRGFCQSHTRENEIINGAIDFDRMAFFLSLHEDPSKDKFYLYYSDLAGRKKYEKLTAHASKYFAIYNGRDLYGDPAKNGLVPHHQNLVDKRRTSRCTLENRSLNSGVHYLCLETPGKASLSDRTRCVTKTIQHVLEDITLSIPSSGERVRCATGGTNGGRRGTGASSKH